MESGISEKQEFFSLNIFVLFCFYLEVRANDGNFLRFPKMDNILMEFAVDFCFVFDCTTKSQIRDDNNIIVRKNMLQQQIMRCIQI